MPKSEALLKLMQLNMCDVSISSEFVEIAVLDVVYSNTIDPIPQSMIYWFGNIVIDGVSCGFK